MFERPEQNRRCISLSRRRLSFDPVRKLSSVPRFGRGIASVPTFFTAAELRTQTTPGVATINHESLYRIVAVLGVSILGCACVLTYSVCKYSNLKKNVDEARQCIAFRGAEVDTDRHDHAVGVGGVTVMGDSRCLTVTKVPVTLDDWPHEASVNTEAHRDTSLGDTGNDSFSVGLSLNDTFVAIAKVEACAAVTQRPNIVRGESLRDGTSAAVAAAAHSKRAV